jgi:hypothetical protein
MNPQDVALVPLGQMNDEGGGFGFRSWANAAKQRPRPAPSDGLD